MQIGLRQFDSQTLDRFATDLRSGEWTRHRLARELCRRTDWHNAQGKPCLSAAARVLPALSERVGIALTAPRQEPRFDRKICSAPQQDVPCTAVSCSMADLGPISLQLVTDMTERRLWEAMIDTHHP